MLDLAIAALVALAFIGYDLGRRHGREDAERDALPSFEERWGLRKDE